jgi:hypothetical protein
MQLYPTNITLSRIGRKLPQGLRRLYNTDSLPMRVLSKGVSYGLFS